MSTAPKRAASPENTARETTALNHEKIARLAFEYWEARGRPIGSPDEDWLRAERHLLMEQLVWGSGGRKGTR